MTDETKTCKACGRELPLDEFPLSKNGSITNTCRQCRTSARLATLRKNREYRGGKTAPFSDELLDGNTPRQIIDLMVRCRKWLESRGYEINMSCIYKEVKIRKIKLE